jgi:hypothetical protein
VPLLLWQREGTLSTFLRFLEVPLLGWTSFMVLFAAGMDPSRSSYALVAGAVIYTIGAAWSDLLVWKSMRTVTHGSP